MTMTGFCFGGLSLWRDFELSELNEYWRQEVMMTELEVWREECVAGICNMSWLAV